MSQPAVPRAPSARRVLLRRAAAVAGAIGGAAWAIKATVTLATGDEPPAMFAIGFALFPFALLGLWPPLHNDEGRASAVGGILAVAAAVSVVLAALARAVGEAAVEPSDEEITVLTPFTAIGGFGQRAGAPRGEAELQAGAGFLHGYGQPSPRLSVLLDRHNVCRRADHQQRRDPLSAGALRAEPCGGGFNPGDQSTCSA